MLAKGYRNLGRDYLESDRLAEARRVLVRSIDCFQPPYASREDESDDAAGDASAFSLLARTEVKCQAWDQAAELADARWSEPLQALPDYRQLLDDLRRREP